MNSSEHFLKKKKKHWKLSENKQKFLAKKYYKKSMLKQECIGWLKSSFGFFLMMRQKNPNELLGQCDGFQ